jgi:predicted aminopeptidase
VNNAYLELYRLYYEGGGFYRDLYEKSGGSLPRFIAAAKTLVGREKDPKGALAAALGLQPDWKAGVHTPELAPGYLH